MNYRTITKVTCRLMALYFFIITLNYIPNFIVNLIMYRDSMSDMSYQIYGSLAIIGPMLLISILLWIFADGVAKLIVKEPVETQEAQGINDKSLAAIAFAVVGLFVLSNAIPDLANLIIQYVVLSRDPQMGMENILYTDFIPMIAREVIRISLGIWLVFGTKGIAKSVTVFKEYGTQTITKQSVEESEQ